MSELIDDYLAKANLAADPQAVKLGKTIDFMIAEGLIDATVLTYQAFISLLWPIKKLLENRLLFPKHEPADPGHLK